MRKISMGEILGTKQGNEITLDNLHEFLGVDKTPDMPRNAVGRHRLIQALRGRYGDQFRNVKMLKKLVDDFDAEIRHAETIHKLKKIKV